MKYQKRAISIQTAGLLACILLLSALVGCGGIEPVQTSRSEAATSADVLTPPDAAVSTLFGIPYVAGRRVNPITETVQENRDVDALLFDPLFRVNDSFQAEPAICASVETDNNTLVLNIRQDVVFHDGSRLSAKDVLYSLNMAKEHEDSVYRDRFAGVESMETDGSFRVRLTLSAAHPSLPVLLDIPILKNGTGVENDAVGSGRYCVMESDGQSYLVPNTTHYSGQGGAAQMTHLLLVDVSDAEALVYGALSGNLGVLRPSAAGSDISLHSNADRYRIRTTELVYVGFRVTSGLFADADVRRAAAAWLIDSKPGGSDLSDAGRFFPALLGYDLTETETTSAVFSAEGSVRLLIAADAPTDVRAAAEAVRLRLESAGLTVEWVEKTAGGYETALRNGAFDLYVDSWDVGADFDFRGLLATGGSQNRTGSGSTTLDGLLTAYVRAGTADGEMLARQIEAAADELAAVVPLGYRYEEMLVNRRFGIRNVRPVADDLFYNIYDWICER